MEDFSLFGSLGLTSREAVIPPSAKPTATTANTRTVPNSNPIAGSFCGPILSLKLGKEAAQCTRSPPCVKGWKAVDIAFLHRHLRDPHSSGPTFYDTSAVTPRVVLLDRGGARARRAARGGHADARRSARSPAV